jgi:tRNA (guanine-N7-)-methyltransferase
MNIFESESVMNTYFPEGSPDEIKIDHEGQSNSGKAGKSVRLHERVPQVEISDAESDTYFRAYTGEQFYRYADEVAPIDGTELFGDDDPLCWDFGCGRGERIVELASRNPDELYVGVDTHQRSLMLGVRAAANAELDNIRFIRANASLLAPFIPSESAQSASILFPAPLPSKRQGFDGMPTPDLTQNIHRILEKIGSPFEFSSDSEPYFNYRMRQIGATGLFSCQLDELNIGVGNIPCSTRYQKIWESKGISTHFAIVRKRM